MPRFTDKAEGLLDPVDADEWATLGYLKNRLNSLFSSAPVDQKASRLTSETGNESWYTNVDTLRFVSVILGYDNPSSSNNSQSLFAKMRNPSNTAEEIFHRANFVEDDPSARDGIQFWVPPGWEYSVWAGFPGNVTVEHWWESDME